MSISKENLERVSFSVLSVVKINANIEILLSDTFDYYDLLQTINTLKRNGLLRDYLGELQITDIGLEELTKLETSLGLGKISKMIIPDFRYNIEKIAINEVYLP